MNIELENRASEDKNAHVAKQLLPIERNEERDGFVFQLSVSREEVHSKEQGKKKTEFDIRTLDTSSEEELKTLFRTRNYSTNVWNSISREENYIGMTGVTLDFDSGITVEEAKERFASYRYILHTSSSHQTDEAKTDRFRVILPFDSGEVRFPSSDECKKVYHKLLNENKEADANCKDPGRKYFPHTDEMGAEFVFHVNTSGKFFDIDISDVPDDVLTRFTGEYIPSDELGTREELERVLKFDPFIAWCQEHAEEGLPEPLWYAMISSLCRFEGGSELIHKISSQDKTPGRYDFGETEEKIAHAFESSAPMGYEEICKRGWPGKAPSKPFAPAGWGKIGRVNHREPSTFTKKKYLMYEDNLIVQQDGTWKVSDVERLKALLLSQPNLRAVCPFCDSDGAMITRDTFKFIFLKCTKCEDTFFEYPITPGMFSYKTQIYRVEAKSNRFINAELMTEDSFRSRREWQFARKMLLNDPQRKFLDDNFQIQRIGSVDFNVLDYELDIPGNALVYKYPALPENIADNTFIDAWLEGMFGIYTSFIKNWLAMYCYTNYVTLPVIVLTGERGTGKNTFAEMVGKIFPSLMGLWDGDARHFTDVYVNKLLFVDENPNADKATQYTEIKKLTGNARIPINKKYQPEYYAPNNIKIIIATNDPKPMFVKWQEAPKSESVNNFFMHQCPVVPVSKINNRLASELEDRLGHYVRTELKVRYEKLAAVSDIRSRYALPAYITPLARRIFASSKTSVDTETEELARYLVCGISEVDPYNINAPCIHFEPTKHEGGLYVQEKEIRNLINRLRFKGSKNIKAYIESLNRQNVLTHKNDYRTSKEYLGYKILRKPEYYTASGYISPFDDVNDVG
ncbi:MAG: primase-helicase family protein [bacterium]